MLRKRTRSLQKDQQQQMGHLAFPGSESYYTQPDHSLGNSKKGSSFFIVPRLFVGFCPKGLSDCDSVRSPTSPLDAKVFSSLGSPYRSPRSPNIGQPRNWGFNKVGLSIVGSLDDDGSKLSGKVLRSSDSKNILFVVPERSKNPTIKPQVNSFEAAKSLPRNFAILSHNHTKSPLQKGNSEVIFEIEEAPFEPDWLGNVRSSSLDSCRPFSTLFPLSSQINIPGSGKPLNFPGGSLKSNSFGCKNMTSRSMSVGSSRGFIGSLSASEIERSEDYTCIISHGPIPKTTHIYGDCILECHPDVSSDFGKNCTKQDAELSVTLASSTVPTLFPSNDFLSFCNYCGKELEEGKDIFIYRGDKAFCSLDCRSKEIMIDEVLEKNIETSGEDPPELDDGEELFEAGIELNA